MLSYIIFFKTRIYNNLDKFSKVKQGVGENEAESSMTCERKTEIIKKELEIHEWEWSWTKVLKYPDDNGAEQRIMRKGDIMKLSKRLEIFGR